MTLLELLATIAMLMFLAWGSVDITYKINLMMGLKKENRFLREWRNEWFHHFNPNAPHNEPPTDVWNDTEH